MPAKTGTPRGNSGKEAAQEGELKLSRISPASGDEEGAGLVLKNPKKDEIIS